MMQSYIEHNIQELPMSSPFFRQRVERFLGENGLRMEDLDVYCAIENESGNILAGAGIRKDIIKCIAVAEQARSEGLVAPLVSHLISLAATRGISELKLFTKPENRAIFESLGFHVLASAPKAILMENGRGLERYCAYLRSKRKEGRCGVVVMNANPFTLGHRYLLEQASKQVDTLYVIPVKEDVQLFSYEERKQMIEFAEENYFSQGFAKNQFSSACKITVLEGSDYQISAATFPTYFLKDLSDAAETHIRLDLDLFQRHIAPALNAEVRFVGTEPDDALTNHYNTIMKEELPCVVEVPRLMASAGQLPEENYFSQGFAKNQFSSASISASSVRKALEEGSMRKAAALCPETTWPYFLAVLADRALRLELDTPGKPGLVGPDSNGAHKDMDYGTMLSGIQALRPFWPRMAKASSAEELRLLGIEAEEAMMKATGGVNTHRGAIFCMGLTLNAWAQGAHTEELLQLSIGKTAQGIYAINQSINNLPPRAAMQNALGGYKQLFEDWLPYYRKEVSLPGASALLIAEGRDTSFLLKLLLWIMSTLDDTCVIKRAGAERARQVKEEAKEMAGRDPSTALGMTKELCERYAAEGISPGGAADMLALTIFIHSIIS